MQIGDAEEDAQHRAERRHRGDAERAGIGERIAQVALHRCPGEAQRRADQRYRAAPAAVATRAGSCDRSHPGRATRSSPARCARPRSTRSPARTTSASSDGMTQRRVVIVRPARAELRSMASRAAASAATSSIDRRPGAVHAARGKTPSASRAACAARDAARCARPACGRARSTSPTSSRSGGAATSSSSGSG